MICSEDAEPDCIKVRDIISSDCTTGAICMFRLHMISNKYTQHLSLLQGYLSSEVGHLALLHHQVVLQGCQLPILHDEELCIA